MQVVFQVMGLGGKQREFRPGVEDLLGRGREQWEVKLKDRLGKDWKA